MSITAGFFDLLCPSELLIAIESWQLGSLSDSGARVVSFGGEGRSGFSSTGFAGGRRACWTFALFLTGVMLDASSC